MTLPRGIRCARCSACYLDEPADGQPMRMVHPEACVITGAFVCPSCAEKSQAKVKAEVEAARKRAMRDLIGGKE